MGARRELGVTAPRAAVESPSAEAKRLGQLCCFRGSAAGGSRAPGRGTEGGTALIPWRHKSLTRVTVEVLWPADDGGQILANTKKGRGHVTGAQP